LGIIRVETYQMPIEIAWFDEEKTIFVGTFIGDWTWDDYINSAPQVIEMIMGLDYRIDQIIDMRESGPIPSGPALMNFHRSDNLTRHQFEGIVVLVGASPILHGLVSALAMTNPQRKPRLFAESMEEALSLIHTDRKTKKPFSPVD
jgi:hypothetical protein